jgi:hypothetical protein
MIRTLAWKEYREHQNVWIALAAATVFVLVGVTPLIAPNGVASAPHDRLVPLVFITLFLAVTYGLVCGGLMVAGERETKTLPFLDTLPAARIWLWTTKCLMGALFALAQGLLMAAVVKVVGLADVKSLPADWHWALPAVTLEAYAFGLFGSVFGQSVLTSIGWAAIPLSISWVAGAEMAWPPSQPLIMFRIVWATAMLAIAGQVFCVADFHRGLGTPAGTDEEKAPVSSRVGWGPEGRTLTSGTNSERTGRPRRRRQAIPSATSGWRVLVWLIWRQGRPQLVLLAVIGLLVGLLGKHTGFMNELVIWPLATLLVGVVCGIGVFTQEQEGEFYRFLGNQRLPPGCVWRVKVGVWLALVVAVAAVILLCGASRIGTVHALQGPQDTQRLWTAFVGSGVLLSCVPKDLFLLLWLLYGFSIGQFSALVWRKSAVALVVGFLMSVGVVAVWVPSLISGGLQWWQVLPVPALLLLATRRALWTWVGGGKPVPGLLACCTLAGLWMGGNLVYRVCEVPDLGAPFDVDTFTATLPKYEENIAGRLIRQAIEDLNSYEAQLNIPDGGFVPGAAGPDFIQQGGAPAPDQPAKPRNNAEFDFDYAIELNQVLEKGWPKAEGRLGPWLDRMFKGKWVPLLRGVAAAPLGVVDDPRRTSPDPTKTVLGCPRAAQLLVARALQLQNRGDHAAALDHLVWTLALSRNLRNKALEISCQSGRVVEYTALRGLDEWLDRLGPQPDLLRRALQELNQHEVQVPTLADSIKAEYLVLRDRLEDPARWVIPHAAHDSWTGLERELITMSWQTPWEKERATRLLNALCVSRLRQAQLLPSLETVGLGWNDMPGSGRMDAALLPDAWKQLLTESPLLLQLVPPAQPARPALEALSLCRVRGIRLKLALALYQVQEGRPAPSLGDLVPRYLMVLPVDPFSGESFRYRISAGETIQWYRTEGEPPETREAAPGEGVVWSVGPDGVDNGGTKHSDQYPFRNSPLRLVSGHDVIFLVPSWPE